MTLFDAAQKQRIEAAIAELEQHTRAEVVVAVVPHSTRPWVMRSLASFACGLVAALLFLDFAPALDPRLALCLELLVMLAAFALFGARPLERLLISPRAAGHEVEQHAFALFARRGLHRTRGHTGVLILLSELERRAVILGDAGIHAELGDHGWQGHVDRIVGAIRRGQAADGLVEVLGELARVLAEIAPAEAQNDNELPNTVVDESDA
jgi:putative membrane protein